MNREKIHRGIFVAGLVLLIAGLPFSEFFLSISQIILAGNWLIEGRFREKWNKLRVNRLAWIFLSLYFIHVIGLLWTTDFSYALKDLRVKAPIFILTLILSTSEAPCRKVFRGLLAFFTVAVFFSTLYSYLVYQGLTGKEIIDIRDISVFISNIRLSLMVCLSVAALYYFFMFDELFKPHLKKILLLLPALWFLWFLVVLESVTGISILLILSLFIVFNLFRNIQSPWLRSIPAVLLTGLVIVSFFYIKKQIADFYIQRETDEKMPALYTKGGEMYEHKLENKEKENGYFVYRYMAWKELERAWKRSSNIPFDSLDNNNQGIRYTLLRFMTSKGLRKDSVGFLSLSHDEIHEIENGTANILYMKKSDLKARIHSLIWEYDNYIQYGNPSGHSATMRIEFWKNGWQIFKNNLIIGVGTGDINQAYKNQYEISKSKLQPRWRLKTHNEYLTMAILFGIPGLLLFLLVLFYPLYTKKHFLYVPFFLILIISMLTEDTLETSTGVTFYAFFSVFLTLSAKNDILSLSEKKHHEKN
ncbi:MAG: O-antigen ligase family protein [Bacteroidota bacterium]